MVNPLQMAFELYARHLVKWPSKLAVVIVTSVIFGFSVWGNYYLKQEFDPMLFLPKDSYLKLFWETRAR
jgi:hypothetical protein